MQSLEPSGSPEHLQAKAEAKARITGLWIFLGGLAASAFFIGWPIWEARHGSAEISITMKGVGISLILLLVGLLKIFIGSAMDSLLKPDKNNLKFKDVALILALAGTGIGAYFWLQSYLAGLGYQF